MSSRDLFAASRDLFINIKNLLVIFDPTNKISINSHLLLPINSPMGRRWETLGPLLICSFACLTCWSSHSISSLLSFYLISRLFGGKIPTAGAHRARHVLFFFRERWYWARAKQCAWVIICKSVAEHLRPKEIINRRCRVSWTIGPTQCSLNLWR